MTEAVSVIVPAYNARRYVVSAVRSALEQEHAPHEVIVVDDGSTDGTGDLLEREFGTLIRLHRQANSGVSAARNAGIAAAEGEIIAFLDADDEWLPSKLGRQVAALTADGIGLVHCGVQDIDASGQALTEHLNGMSGCVSNELLLLQRPVILGGGSGIVVPREILRRVGGFDTRLSTSADWDFFYRVATHYDVAFIPEVLLRYRIHDGNMHGNIDLMREDMLLAFSKAFSGPNAPQKLRSRSYAKLYLILAGGYAADKRPLAAARCIARAARLRPAQLRELLHPAWRRVRHRPAASGARHAPPAANGGSHELGGQPISPS